MSASVVHVERTGDPFVLRWVTHLDALETASSGDRSVPADAELARFVGDGRVLGVRVERGDVLVRARDAAEWPSLVAEVHDAVVADLSSLATWPLSDRVPGRRQAADEPLSTVTDLQCTIDHAVGGLLAAHGGRVEVVSIVEGRVVVLLHGACRGCGGVGATLHGTARAAVLHAHPDVTDLVEAAATGRRGCA